MNSSSTERKTKHVAIESDMLTDVVMGRGTIYLLRDSIVLVVQEPRALLRV